MISFEEIKSKLARIGYYHEGDIGIKDRQAFKYIDKSHLMKHHLYVCPEYSDELKRHIAFRDYLRTHKEDRDWYGEVKLLAAKYYPEDINSYMTAKNLAVQKYLGNADFNHINNHINERFLYSLTLAILR